MVKGTKTTLKWILAMAQVLLFCSICEATRPISPFVRSIDGVKVLNFTAVNSCQKVYKASQTSYFPKRMRNVNSSEKVFQEIVNYNFKNLFNQAHMKSFKKQAETVSEGFASSYKSEDGHKLAFKLDAIRSNTELKYSGAVEAKLSYKLNNKSINFEVTKKLAAQTQLVFTHNDKSNERSDLLALRFSF